MLTRETLAPEEKEKYNKLVTHVLQSWEWGEFREKTGVKVIRPGLFEKNRLITAYQLTIHSIPHTPYTVGYLPKGPVPDEQMLSALEDIGMENNTIFFKLEPNITINQKPVINSRLTSSPRPLFTRYTFQIDLRKSEEDLLRQMKEKTRYNVRLAQRNGVRVAENNSPEAFEVYLRLMQETTQRQNFYAHSEKYHRLMWETLQKAGIAHLLIADYNNESLVAWILFVFNKVLYYPYGASSTVHREVMASNLMMWEAMKFGQKMGCEKFDLWGALGPEPNPKDPWYGFHRFKEGYGGELVEFVGSYDFVLNWPLYKLYNLADNLRWGLLRLKSRINPG
ncbi:peptidoglycan bridge formation glycyltransferase FemA/FemB family protein [Candidatus Microgenomates bacterium]|nr:peptidoglycan bridge formation glycyltransferase FemA/FemB family protein [Candidatus Microgenomates bacterium]